MSARMVVLKEMICEYCIITMMVDALVLEAGDHQLTGARLCMVVLVVETNQGLVKLIGHQCAEVKTQSNSILSSFQVPGSVTWYT